MLELTQPPRAEGSKEVAFTSQIARQAESVWSTSLKARQVRLFEVGGLYLI